MNPSELIDNQIAELTDWRGEMYAGLRRLIRASDPKINEDWKWGTAVFTANGNVCALGAFKDHIKVNFFKGASLEDPHGLFNSGLDAKASRSIDLYEGDSINESSLNDLVRAAVAQSGPKK